MEMIIKTTIAALSSQGLGMALQKLNGAQVSTRTAYRFKKLHDVYNTTMNKVRESYTKAVVEVYGELDEKKKPVLDNTKPWGFKLKEGVTQEEFDKANDAFHKMEITLDRAPLALSELMDVKLSAAELTALGDFLVDPETHGQSDNVTHLAR